MQAIFRMNEMAFCPLLRCFDSLQWLLKEHSVQISKVLQGYYSLQKGAVISNALLVTYFAIGSCTKWAVFSGM